jgi:hypothetical protein
MMQSERYLKKKQKMINKSGVKLVTVKIVIRIKNKKSYLTRNLILISSKKDLKEDKLIKDKSKTFSSLLIILMMKWI